jgi:hypothetical protein
MRTARLAKGLLIGTESVGDECRGNRIAGRSLRLLLPSVIVRYGGELNLHPSQGLRFH